MMGLCGSFQMLIEPQWSKYVTHFALLPMCLSVYNFFCLLLALIFYISHLQASNSYLQFLRGAGTKMLLEYVKEMPKPETRLRIDLSSLLGTLFFTWVVLQLFPVSIYLFFISVGSLVNFNVPMVSNFLILRKYYLMVKSFVIHLTSDLGPEESFEINILCYACLNILVCDVGGVDCTGI